jgi:hypothetical protein
MSFAWSFSKLDNYETCPKKYEAYSVSKSVKEDSTENLDWGNEVHDAMRDALKKVKPLPEHMAPYQPWIDRVLSGPGDLLVEQKYAMDKSFSPVPYFSPSVWFRGIADAIRINDEVALAIDWKTGRRKEGSIQLGLMALCLFQHFSKLQAVRAEFVWLQEDPTNIEAATTKEIFHRSYMQQFVAELLPRVQKLQWAHDTNTWEPKPSGICVKHCKVVSCPFHGRGNR